MSDNDFESNFGQDEYSQDAERMQALMEASFAFGLGLNDLLRTHEQDVTIDVQGRKTLVLQNRIAGPKSEKDLLRVATIVKPSAEIVPSLTFSSTGYNGRTITRRFSFNDLVYARSESHTSPHPISGFETSRPIDNTEDNSVTTKELDNTLDILGSLSHKRVLIEAAEHRYKQTHGLRGFVRKYVLGKISE